MQHASKHGLSENGNLQLICLLETVAINWSFPTCHITSATPLQQHVHLVNQSINQSIMVLSKHSPLESCFHKTEANKSDHQW